jgi:hypothetical protein
MATAASAGHYLISPAKDSTVHSHTDWQDTNLGLEEEVASWCSYYSGWRMRFYMTFDLSAIAPSEDVDGLTLLLYQSNGCGFSPWLNFHNVVDDSWDETTITWNNQPDDGGAYLSPPFAVADVYQWHRGWVSINLFNESWDTAFIDNGYFSFLVKENETGDMGHAFYSKDYPDSTLHPVLIVHTDGTCEGDIDGDGDIDGIDLAVMAADYHRDDCGGATLCPGDIDGDLTVGMKDLVLFAHGYGRVDCPE